MFGGERGIRTLDKVAPVPPFQGGNLNRSYISPYAGADYSRSKPLDQYLAKAAMTNFRQNCLTFEQISIYFALAFNLHKAAMFKFKLVFQ